METTRYTEILEQTLTPFIQMHIYRFMANTDLNHTSRYAHNYIEERGINWWRTPAELPDLNLLKNLWHELKELIRTEVKPKTKQEMGLK